MVDTVAPDFEWDALFIALEAWREDLVSVDGVDPSVTAIAKDWNADPWAVLVSTIISLRTKDEVTLVASRRLLGAAPTPAALLALSEEDVSRLIFPAGFYRTKAKNLAAISETLLAQYGGQVPSDLDSLLSLPGVGLKTANLVLAEAFGQDAICVDTHVHRIANRLALIETTSANRSEAALRTVVPKRYWRILNPLLVLFGQRVCTPTSPRCSGCPVATRCPRHGVLRSR